MDMAWRMGVETLAVPVVVYAPVCFITRGAFGAARHTRAYTDELKELRIVCENRAVYDAVAERLASMQEAD